MVKKRYALPAIAAGMAGAAWLLDRHFAARPHHGPVSDHFDGEQFHNGVELEHGVGAFLQWVSTREAESWPDWIENDSFPPPPRLVNRTRVRATFVNHSTVLLQFDDVNVLTDPVWSNRVSPVTWTGPRRHRNPGIAFDDLPPIDVVLISHNHYDHLDLDTLRRLEQRDRPDIVTGLGNAAYLVDRGFTHVREGDWWDAVELRGKRITIVPARHFSSRALSDRNRSLWCGFVIESEAGLLYFAGDTGYESHFTAIRERLGAPRLALLPIGAFLPRWFMSPVHMSPQEAVTAHDDLQAAISVPIHYGTFPLGDDGPDTALQVLRSAMQGREGIRILAHGESLEIG